jgi:hypothetical protein
MEEPYLTLFTIAVNTLITYFLLNRQERRLSEKAFQQQIKFQRTHEKRVETLENIYQKFQAFGKAARHELWNLMGNESRGKPIEFTKEDVEYLKDFNVGRDELDECRNYFKKNRLYLTESTAEEIDKIINKAYFTYGMVSMVSKSGDMLDRRDALINFLNERIEEEGYNIHKMDPENPNLLILLSELALYTSTFTERLETLYRASADID